MKTNEQTVKDLLKRKEEYDKKQVQRRGMIRVLSAALAAVLIVLAIPSAIFTAVKLNEGPAPVPAVTAEQSPRDEETNAASERPATPAETEPLTEAATDEEEVSTSISDFYFPGDKTTIDFTLYDVDVKKEIPGLEVLKNQSGNTIAGYAHTGSLEFEYTISRMPENKAENAMFKPLGDSDGVYIYFEPVGSLEIVGEDIYYVDLSGSSEVTVNVETRYKDEKKIGNIMFWILSEEDGEKFITDHKEKGYTSSDIEVFKDFQYRITGYCVYIKGYDFFGGPITWIYRSAAIYFGDVDENGEPLYYSDPYMEDYYNNPFCEYLRGEVDTDDPDFWIYYNDSAYIWDYQKGYNSYTTEDYSTENERVEETGYSLTSAYNDTNDIKNGEKGDVFTTYTINITGTINWSASDNSVHPARYVKVCLIDSNSDNILETAYTNTNGYYSISSVVLIAAESLNIDIKAFTDGHGISVKNYNKNITLTNLYNSTFYHANNISTYYSNTVNKTFVRDNEFETNEVFNRALSVHQSLVLTNEYSNSLISDTELENLTVLFMNNIYYDDYDNPIGTAYNHVYDYMIVEYYDGYDWDVTEHEYGHFIEDTFHIMSGISGNNSHAYYVDLSALSEYPDGPFYGKDKAIKMAWNEGYADFFAINAQRVMNASSLNIPYVGDSAYRDTQLYYCPARNTVIPITTDISIDIESVIDETHSHTIHLGETNEITVAALLLDLVDSVSVTDSDITMLNDSKIWGIIIGDEDDSDDGCKTLSQFMMAFHESTDLTGHERLYSMYLLRRYNLNPYNINVAGAGGSSPFIGWSNVSSSWSSKIRVFGPQYNELYTSGEISQSYAYIPSDKWGTIKNNYNYVYLVIEGLNNGTESSDPQTEGYYSSYVIITF